MEIYTDAFTIAWMIVGVASIAAVIILCKFDCNKKDKDNDENS